MNSSQVLGLLARSDKHFLGGGRMLLWAPEFPLWLDQPGFWDHACFLDYKVAPLFTVTLLDKRGREIHLPLQQRYWQPDHSSQIYHNKAYGLTVTERRALLPSDVLCSTFEFSQSLEQAQIFEVIVWSCQEPQQESQGFYELAGYHARENDHTLVWHRQIRETSSDTIIMNFAVGLTASEPPLSYEIRQSDRQPNYPRWKYSPFYEKLAEHGKLSNQVPTASLPDFAGLTYFGQHYRLTVPANGKRQFSVFAAVAITEEGMLLNLNAAKRLKPSSTGKSEVRATSPAKDHWKNFFDSVPNFVCSDPYLQKYYWYRWYGLRLNTIQASESAVNLPYPCVFEGINQGWFRQHISYSAQCHMLETRWMHDPILAQGSILNFIANQLEDGSFPGAIKNILRGDHALPRGAAFYHANWGRGVRELYRIHPDLAFLEKVYAPLCRYAEYFDRVRDAEHSGLYDVLNHWETGQEFMSRYQQIDPRADEGGSIRLKGLDATVYQYELQESLAWMATELNLPHAQAWQVRSERTRQALLNLMWDAKAQFFFDVNPSTMQRTTAKAALGFYPFLSSSLATSEHLGIFKHLFDPAEFWTAYPLPSTSKADPTYSADGEWKDRRLVCPWNGRTWLMTNSHVADALCRVATELDPSLAAQAVEFMRRFIKMLFLDGNLDRPSSYEYYNPETGQAPYFRGTDDYMHSWIVDLIIKYVVGIQVGDNRQLKIRPLPFELDYFVLDQLKIAGYILKISWRKSAETTNPLLDAKLPIGLAVWVDGELRAQEETLKPLDINLAARDRKS